MPSDNHIILVENDLAFAASIISVLRLLGWRVTYAASGETALDRSETDAPAVAIVDANLGRMNGQETIVRLRAMHPGLRAIGMSGQEVCRQTMLAAGAVHFLMKPFSPAELIHHLPVRSRTRRFRLLNPPAASDPVESVRPLPEPLTQPV